MASSQLIRVHLSEHPKCVLQKVDVMRGTYNSGDFDNRRVRAISDVWNKRVIWNSAYPWKDDEEIRITIVHEALHICGICGPDRPGRTDPKVACILWGEWATYDREIDEAIVGHIGDSLKNR